MLFSEEVVSFHFTLVYDGSEAFGIVSKAIAINTIH